MNSHHFASLFLHWFWTAFFALFGIYLITRWDARVRPYVCAAGLNTADGDLRERLRAAVDRRQSAEGTPPNIGLWAGVPCLGLAALAAFTAIPYSLLYAVLCLTTASAMGAAFMRLRNVQPKRVAVLAVRKPASVIPSYWFALAILSAISVLAFAQRPGFTLSAIAVCIASLLSAAIAWRLTQLPALLSGVDVEAEQIVDGRLRVARSSVAMVYALVQTFVFCTQASSGADMSAVQIGVYWFNFVPWIAFGIWMARNRFVRLKPSAV